MRRARASSPSLPASLSLQTANATIVDALGARFGASLSFLMASGGMLSGMVGGGTGRCCVCVHTQPLQIQVRLNATTLSATGERRQSIVHLANSRMGPLGPTSPRGPIRPKTCGHRQPTLFEFANEAGG